MHIEGFVPEFCLGLGHADSAREIQVDSVQKLFLTQLVAECSTLLPMSIDLLF